MARLTYVPSIAVVITVLRETRWLRMFVRWHRAAGVQRFYVYLDGDSEAIRDTLKGEDDIVFIPDERDRVLEHQALFQVRCMDDGRERARDDGFDWVLFIDPDEYAWGSCPPETDGFSLSAMLAGVEPSIEQVRLKTQEAVPLKTWVEEPFWKHLYVIEEDPVVRDVLDPLTGTQRSLDRWMGHKLGKTLIRTNADVRAYNPHGWTKDTSDGLPSMRPPAETVRGCHLHIPVLHGRQWKEKYTAFRHHSVYPHGAVMQFPKSSWARAAATMTEDACRDYVHTGLALSPSQVDNAVQSGILSRASMFERMMAQLGAEELFHHDDVCTR